MDTKAVIPTAEVLETSVPGPDATSGGPPGELEPNGSRDLYGQVRGVLDDLARRPERDAAGRFIPGSLAAGKSLERSEAFWSVVAAAKRELVEAVSIDLAADEQATTTLVGVIDAYAEARLLRMAMFMRLTDLGGVITGKGKMRALYRAWCAAMDRELKLAQVLGLERRSKRVESFAVAIAQEPEHRE